MNETPSTQFSSGTPGTQPTHEQISARAQQLWENYGRPTGRDEEIWFAAESQLKAPPPASNDGSTPPPSSRTGRLISPETESFIRPATEQAMPRPAPRTTSGRRGGKAAGR